MTHFTPTSKAELYDLLKEYWDFSSFRFPQEEVIQRILMNKSCLAIMPTGSGKSLCYQCLSLLSNRLILVVSPLIALMDDQVLQANQLGIHAAGLHSGMTAYDRQTVLERMRSNDVKLLFVSPERLQVLSFKKLIKEDGISLLVVDEAHCISQWGYDFRPSYLHIRSFIKQIDCPCVLALSATATGHVQKDIRRELNIAKSDVFQASLFRKNLSIQFKYVIDKREFLANQLSETACSIVYIQHRERAEQIVDYLRNEGFEAIAYHAGLDKTVRANNQALWMNGKAMCIVATSAFGMGINKADVRYVYHYNLPNSMEDYYQEMGRAGRDGVYAECITLYNHKDLERIKKHRFSLHYLFSNRHQRSKTRSAIRMLGLQNRSMCRSKYVLDYFGERLLSDCGICDNCYRSKRANVQTNKPVIEHDVDKSELEEFMSAYGIEEHEQVLAKLNILIDEGKIQLKDAYLEWTKE